ncbi:MAG: NAD(P)/FAD-dependent oxidoreductase [Burkholderiaceae bacterium]
MNNETLIIGSGLAGITLARELRKLDKERAITIITANDGSFYSKPNLSNAFAARKPLSEMVLMTTAKLENDLAIRILPHTVVADINAATREITCTKGTLRYDQLVLAIGASQIPLPLAGDGVSDAISVNDMNDYALLRDKLAGKRRVAIIGAGLIGCEFANDLRLGNFEVDVFDIAAQPLARLLPEAAAIVLHAKLSEIGINFHLLTNLASIQRDGATYNLIDSCGTARKYDLVLSAIGLRPNLGLAKSAKLATRIGILTDCYLRTSDPQIYALGDCIEIEGQYLPYVMPIMQGAKKLAATLAGTPEAVTYPAMPIVVKTPACPMVISTPQKSEGYWEELVTDEGVRALYIDRVTGQATGFVLLGAFTKERVALANTMPGIPTQ